MPRKRIEILTFDRCPNADPARALVERVLRELAVDADVDTVRVADEEAAQRLLFLGSPSIRVDGQDVEPGAGEREDYSLACRVYQTEGGLRPVPDERWLRAALA